MTRNKLEKLLHLVGWFIWKVWWCTDLQTPKSNTYYFPMVARVPRTCFNVIRLYAHCLACYNQGGVWLLRNTNWIFEYNWG